MYTLGFRFRPWTERQAIADGGPILEYIEHARLCMASTSTSGSADKLLSADWSKTENRWTLHIESDRHTTTLTCSFLFMCSGYYNYEQGYSPTFAGSEDFTGPIIHPQHWPEDLITPTRTSS